MAREAPTATQKGLRAGQALDLFLCLSSGEVVRPLPLTHPPLPLLPAPPPSWVRSVRALGNRLAYRRLAFHICLQTHNTLLFQGG